jgi:hypothetical protein
MFVNEPGQAEPPCWDGSIRRRKRGVLMYIGVGTVVVILVIVLIVYVLRRA